MFAHVSGFEYPLSLLLVCYHGSGRIILASTITSRAQACQITVSGGLPLRLAISSSRKHLIFRCGHYTPALVLITAFLHASFIKKGFISISVFRRS